MKQIIFYLVYFFPLLLLADEAVDLNSLGVEDFTPYTFDRDPRWIILPVFTLLVVLLHLIQPRRPRVAETKTPENKP